MLYIKTNPTVTATLESTFAENVSTGASTPTYLDAVNINNDAALESHIAYYDFNRELMDLHSKVLEAYANADGNESLLEGYLRPLEEGFLGEMWNKVKNFFKAIYTAIVKALKGVWSFLKGIYNKVKTKLKEWFKKKDADEKKGETAAAASTSTSGAAAPAADEKKAEAAPVAVKDATFEGGKVIKASVLGNYASKITGVANTFAEKYKMGPTTLLSKMLTAGDIIKELPALLKDTGFITTSNDDAPTVDCKDAKWMLSKMKESEGAMVNLSSTSTLKEYLDQYEKATELGQISNVISKLESYDKEITNKDNIAAYDKTTGGKGTAAVEYAKHNSKLLASVSKVMIVYCNFIQDAAAEASTIIFKYLSSPMKYKATDKASDKASFITQSHKMARAKA